jgi:beta-mannosidase
MSVEQRRFRLSGDWEVSSVPLEYAQHTNNLHQIVPVNASLLCVPDAVHLQPTLYPEQPYWGEHIRRVNESAWLYRRSFGLPQIPHRRARLWFEGVDYYASVWIDNHFIGRHAGHFAPFGFDVTEALITGNEHLLTVCVSSPWDDPNPRGMYPLDHVKRGLVKGLYEHGEGLIPPAVNPLGIWRPVWLLLDDGLSLDHIRIRTETDGVADLLVKATNATGQPWQGDLTLTISAENHDGPGSVQSLPLTLSPGAHAVELALRIPEPRLWWPWDHGEPNLYRLRAELCDSTGRALSAKEEVFGLRTVKLHRSPQRFTYEINERPVFMRGTSCMPDIYLSRCDPETLERDLMLAHDANLNLLRLHVHVSPPELYHLCDRMGMLVWQDFELHWIQDSSPEFEARARLWWLLNGSMAPAPC